MERRRGPRGSWGAYIQGGNLAELEALGSKLSLEISCPVHYPAYGKNVFECKCGVLFPIYFLKYGDWNKVRELHERGPINNEK